VVAVGIKATEASIQVDQVKWQEKTITGSQAHPHAFEPVIEHLAAGAVPAERLITHRLGLGEVPHAFAILESRDESVMKIVIGSD
jgi:threonine dehydrogenase-like Zn-dependent dehydrogenase